MRSFLIGSLVLVATGSLLACVADPTLALSDPDAGGDAGSSDASVVDGTTPMTTDAGDGGSSQTDAGDAAIDAAPPPPSGKYVWNAHIGGPQDDTLYLAGAVYDAKGNLFLTGSFAGQAQFGNAQTLTSLGSVDAFVAKYDPSGTCLGVARIGGAVTVDAGVGIAVDPASQDVVVSGTLFANASAPPIKWSINGGADNVTSNGAFLVKFSNDLSTVKFDQDFAGNSSATKPSSITIGPAGSIIVSGVIQNAAQTSFARSGGVVNGSHLGGPTVGFVAQYASNGAFGFARILSPLTADPSCETFVGGAAVDSQKRIVVAGWALGFAKCKYSADYANNTTVNDIDGTNGNVFFVAKYDDANGGVFQSSKLTAPSGPGYPHAVVIGPNDDVYAAFENQAPSFSFAGKTIPIGMDDGLVLHWDKNGQEKSFLAFSDGASQALPSSLAISPQGNVVIGGWVGGDVDFGSGVKLAFGGGVSDGFVLETDPTLANILWMNAYSGAGRESVLGVASTSSATGAIGVFDDPSFTAGPGQAITGAGSTDFFVVGLKP
jgi:hypothetical protein